MVVARLAPCLGAAAVVVALAACAAPQPTAGGGPEARPDESPSGMHAGGGGPAARSPSPEPEATSDAADDAAPRTDDIPSSPDASGCPNQERANAEQPTNVSTGDVDGDGSDDEVYVAVDRRPGVPATCRAWLVVELLPGRLVTPIVQREMTLELNLPRINTLADIDGRRGHDIVVDVLAGASTGFVAIFAHLDADLVRLQSPARLSGLEDVFAYGGSVGHVDGVDCAGPPGRVVSSFAVPHGSGSRRYRVTRRFLVVDGAAFSTDDGSTERRVLSLGRLRRLPEFGSVPFPSCPR